MWLKLMDAYLLFFAINQFVCREREMKMVSKKGSRCKKKINEFCEESLGFLVLMGF